MRKTVVVTVHISRKVWLDVERADDDDPESLTEAEEARAIEDAKAGFGKENWAEVVETTRCGP